MATAEKGAIIKPKAPAKKRETYTNDYVRMDTDRAVFMQNKDIEALFSAMIALSAEVWTGRRRQKVLESVLAKKVGLTPEDMEAYMPTAEENAEWKAERDRMVKVMFDQFLRPGDIPFGSSRHVDPETDPARWNKKSKS
jgi:hypothetical protein